LCLPACLPQVIIKGDMGKSKVVTPTVVQEVRAQFGCRNLDGAELEDEGGDGTSKSHWEYRLFQVGGCVCVCVCMSGVCATGCQQGFKEGC
jgi:hypothetical protein